MELGAYNAPSLGALDTYMGANFTKYTIVIPADVGPGNYDEAGLKGLLDKWDLGIGQASDFQTFQDRGIDVQIQLHEDLLIAGYNVFTEVYPNINFNDYPSVKGFFIADEPTWAQIDIIDTVYRPWFNANYGNSDMEFYVNLFSSYSDSIGPIRDADGNILTDANGDKFYSASATPEQEEVCYNAYVQKWLTVFENIQSNTKYFTIDSYPLRDNQPGHLSLPNAALPEGYERNIVDGWLSSTYRAASNAKAESLPFGAYIQAFDMGNSLAPTATYRLPTTLAEIKWQAYMYIAFGAKKLVYFGYDSQTNGTFIVDDGALYNLVKETNAELLKVDHVFAAFETWVGVKTFLGTGSQSNAAFEKIAGVELDNLTGVSSVTASRDLVVGEMVDGNGNHGYMLVGYDDPFNGNQTEVSMTFDGAKGVIIYRNGQRSLSEDLVNGQFTVTLEAGEGVFVIPVY